MDWIGDDYGPYGHGGWGNEEPEPKCPNASSLTNCPRDCAKKCPRCPKKSSKEHPFWDDETECGK